MEENFKYYDSSEAEQYTFYRIPKALFTEDIFSGLSCEAKVIYGLMLDRMSLSLKNNWIDEQGRVYIYFKLQDIMNYVSCSHDKAVKLLAELDVAKGIGLIERRKQGMGRPDMIYVKSFTTEQSKNKNAKQLCEKAEAAKTSENQKSIQQEDLGKIECQTWEKQKPGIQKNGILDFRKSETNNTELNNTELNLIYPSICQALYQNDRIDRWEQRQKYKEFLRENIDYPILCNFDSEDMTDELLELMLDILCTTKTHIKIGTKDVPVEAVKNRFMKLNIFHIAYVIDSIKYNTTKIHNIKAYLLTSLYRSLDTLDMKIQNRIAHKILRKNVEYDILVQQHTMEKERIDEILELMAEAICTQTASMLIGGERILPHLVRKRFLYLNMFHIEYILDSMEKIQQISVISKLTCLQQFTTHP